MHRILTLFWRQRRNNNNGLISSFRYHSSLQRFLSSSASTIEQQYSRDGQLLSELLILLETEKDDDTSNLLSKVDAFNSRGVQGRLDLLALLQKEIKIEKHHQIIDIGCGIGGTARYFHNTFNCSVLGVDLTEEYVKVGNYCIQMVKDDDPNYNNYNRVQLLYASALNLPCNDNSMDIAWTEHVQMNVEQKEQFYAEIHRVLVHGGHLAFHDVLWNDSDRQQQQDGERLLQYPCPWADSNVCSFLVTEANLRSHIQQAGLRMMQWTDTTPKTIEFLKRATNAIAKNCNSTTPSLGVHLLMGPNAPTKVQNHLENLLNGKTKTVMGIAVKD